MATPPKDKPIITSISYKDQEGIRYSPKSHEFPIGSLSFQSEACIQGIDKAPIKGFCMRKYKADLMTSGLAYSRLAMGSILRIGSLMVKVTKVGKPCHAKECPAYDQGSPCIMLHETMFGEVINPGRVMLGDEIEVSNG